MTKWIAVVCLPALCFYVVSLAQPVLATSPWTGMPHTFAYKLEPESVSVGSTVKITGTLIPCVDVESLVVYLRLPKASGAEVSLPLVREWRGEGKKGKAINISGDVVFQKPGTYRFSISYSHPHPRYRKSMVWDYRSFIIRVPGGIQTPKAQAELFGEEVGPSNKVVGVRRLCADSARVAQRGDTSRTEAHKLPQGIEVVVTEGTRPGPDTLRRAILPQRSSVEDSLRTQCFKGGAADSVVTAFATLPSAGGTAWAPEVHIIATCDKIFSVVVNGEIAHLTWHVDPPSLGTVVELPDHRARFTAGPAAGVGTLGGDEFEGITYAWPIMVIADYQINGNFLYEDREEFQDLPVKGSLVKLYTVDAQSNDLVLQIDSQYFHFRCVDSTYTEKDDQDYGYYQFTDVNVDSIAVLAHTKCPSHDVVYSSSGNSYYGGYWSFVFEYMMDWWDPVLSVGSETFVGTYRGAFNIMSQTHTGVDYVAGLPGSHFPEKVIMYWYPADLADTVSKYTHEGLTIGGVKYDKIQVSADEEDNPDEWDEDVFLHEYGHFVMDNYAYLLPPEQLPNCGLRHRWEDTTSVECAYAEGWATFYSCACQDNEFFLDTGASGMAMVIDVERPTFDPQGAEVEGAVCASLWDVFDSPNDSTFWDEDEHTWYHNNDRNAGLRWQSINEIWWAIGQPGDLGHFPYTVCDFTYIWAWSGYPTDEVWRNIFNAHGIECTPVGVEEKLASASNTTPFLWPNHPNPFNPLTQIVFRVASYGRVSVRVSDTGGRVVKTLLDSYKAPGTYTLSWDGKDDSATLLASGVYFCHLAVGSFKQTRKLVMLK